MTTGGARDVWFCVRRTIVPVFHYDTLLTAASKNATTTLFKFWKQTSANQFTATFEYNLLHTQLVVG